MRDDAYARLGGAGEGARRLPAVQRRPVPVGHQLRLAPAASDIKKRYRKHGIRNSHLLSIAPTGTISLAFADNASNGIEPPFSWTYTRKKRMPDGTLKEFPVEDHAWRLYTAAGGDIDEAAAVFRHRAGDLRRARTSRWSRRSRRSSTPASPRRSTCPRTIPYEEFKDLYLEAWKSGLKGLTTYRPNKVLGSVLSVTRRPRRRRTSSQDDRNRRIRIKTMPAAGARRACAGRAGPSSPPATRRGPT